MCLIDGERRFFHALHCPLLPATAFCRVKVTAARVRDILAAREEQQRR
jgi:hypothetical protein